MTFIDKGFCKEDDPIFTEGITVFTVRRQIALPEEQEEPSVENTDTKKPLEEQSPKTRPATIALTDDCSPAGLSWELTQVRNGLTLSY